MAEKWFNNNLSKSNLHSYTKRHLLKTRRNGFIEWLSNLSVTGWLVLVNVIFFIIELILLTSFGQDVLYYLALQPNAVITQGYVWTLFTSMFSHIFLWHIFINMFVLLSFGKIAERIIGKKRFFWFYMIAGLSAGFLYVLLSYFFGTTALGARIFGDPFTFALGASGAVFGVLGLLAVLIPQTRVFLLAGPLIALIAQNILRSLAPTFTLLPILDFLLTLYFFISIMALFIPSENLRKIALFIGMPLWIAPILAIVPLIIIGLFFSLPIGNMAHLGGAISGVIYGFYLRNKYPRKTKMLSRMFS